MTSHPLNGRGAAVIDLDPAGALARMLHGARIATGYTSQDALSRVLNVDRSVVTKAESGNRFPSDKVLLKWCEHCHLDPDEVLPKARQARMPDEAVPMWFETFREVELVAHTVRAWHPILIPGPLQIPDYARALFEGMGEGEDRIGELVAARIDLQQVLTRPDPATLWAVMDEAVLRRRVGSDEVMHRQLTHLIEQGRRSYIGIQVVPAIRGANAGCVGAFTIASVEGAPDVLLKEAVEDVTTDKQDVLRKAQTIFDRVRSDALPRNQSLELIAEVAKECKL
jgi:transcriptional regulator with XRE-family HTH domain